MDKDDAIEISDSSVVDVWKKGWNPDRPREIFELSRLGLTDTEMARVMGIALDTLNGWKRDRPEVHEFMERGKTWADAEVVEALHKCAVGYKYKQQVAHTFEGVTTITTLDQEKGPDAWAAAKWLALRQRAHGWSETTRVEVTNTNININKVDFTGIPTEVLLAIEQAQRKHLIDNVGGS